MGRCIYSSHVDVCEIAILMELCNRWNYALK